MILLAAGVINRILGFVPRIALPRVIGAEGVGLYQMGFPFLIVVLTFLTGGIPLAIAKLVAEAESAGNEQRIKSILRVSLFLTSGLSIFFTLLCLALSPWITSHLLTDSRVYYTFLCMSPIIPVVGISAIFRGYFQGRHNMIPTASSQVVETLVRIAAMLLFAYFLLPYGLEYAAAGAMLGVLAGEIGGMFVLLFQYRGSQPDFPLDPPASNQSVAESVILQLRRLLRIAVPVTAGKLVGSSSYFLESIMIVQSLAIAGVATGLATAQYGTLQGMVIPVLLLPSALTYSLSVSLVPSLSEAAARKDMATIHKRLHQSLRLALVTGAPFAVIMYVLADPLTYYLYNDAEVSRYLKMMAPVALFLYFQGPLQAALQALNRPGTALLNTFIGAAVKLILIVQLATKPQWGIMGAVMAINANIVLVTILNWNSIAKLLQFRMNMRDFVKVFAGMFMMGAASYGMMVQPWTDHLFLRFITACAAGVSVYLACVLWMGLVNKFDLQRIPWIGSKLARWL